MAVMNVAQPWFGKPTGVRQHTGARPTDPLSHREPGLHCTQAALRLAFAKTPLP